MKSMHIKFSSTFLLVCVFSLSIFGFGVFSNFPELFRLPRITLYLPRAITLISAFLLIFIIIKYIKERKLFNLSILLFLFFWLIYSVRMFYDIGFANIRMNREISLYLNFAYGISFIPALAILLARNDNLFFKSTEIVMITMGSFCIFAALYMGSIWESDGRLSGNSFHNPIGLGNVACSLCLLIFNKCFQDSKPLMRFPGVLMIFLFIFSFQVLIASGSRGPILAFFIISITLLTVRLNMQKKIISGLFIFFIFLVFYGPIFLEYLTGIEGDLIGRFSVLYTLEKITTDERYLLAIDSYNLFKSSPLIGVGIDLPGRGYPHNIFIEGFTSLGIFGGLLLAFIMFRGIFLSYKLLSAQSELRWASLLYVQYFFGALLSGTIYDNNQFWITLALISSINSVNVITKDLVKIK